MHHDEGTWPEEMPEKTNPSILPFAVTGVRGRFPVRPKALKQEDIEVSITQFAPGEIMVRLDSRTDATFWLSIRIKLRGGDT